MTIQNFERGRDRRPTTPDIEAIQRALELGGIEFTNGDGPGVRLRREGK
jgi:hypothetical protein